MKVTIIVFSPSGNTLNVANMLEKSLETKHIDVQTINITGNTDIFHTHQLQQFLHTSVQEHDVLCIGSPVYAHHLQYYMKDLIRSLPAAKNGWGKLAVPFVTYGGITSGIALEEAGKLLKKSGRVVIAGMKICASHCMTAAFMDEELNTGMPGDEALPVIGELTQRIETITDQTQWIDQSKALNYQPRKLFIKANVIFREKLWHAYMYPKVSIDHEKCTLCGKCARDCPVLHFEEKGKEAIVARQHPSCIHCFNCVKGCPAHAIRLTGNLEKAREFMGKMSEKANTEIPLSAVYPLAVMV